MVPELRNFLYQCHQSTDSLPVSLEPSGIITLSELRTKDNWPLCNDELSDELLAIPAVVFSVVQPKGNHVLTVRAILQFQSR